MKLNIAASALLLSLSSVSNDCHAFTSSPIRNINNVVQNINVNNAKFQRRQSIPWAPSSRSHVSTFSPLMSTLEERKAEMDLKKQIEDSDILSTIIKQPGTASKVASTLSQTRTKVKSYMTKYLGQSGASVIYSKLNEYNVEVVNGYSGGANLPLIDQFHEKNPRHLQPGAPPPIRWITNSNENSAGHVAEGYAKASFASNGAPRAGVVIATSGPGVTNLITPLQDALCDGVPIVALCGQAATFAPLDAFQSADAVGLTTPCTKWSYQIKSAVELPFVMDYAFFVATSGRPGPVFIDCPKDLLSKVVTEEDVVEYVQSLPVLRYGMEDGAREKDEFDDELVKLLVSTQPNLVLDKTFSDSLLRIGNAKEGLDFELQRINGHPVQIAPVTLAKDDTFHLDHHPSNTIIAKGRNKMGLLGSNSPLMSDLVSLISNAQKPIIIAGQGCNDAVEELKLFAETLQIPVTTTLHALGCFDERHPLALNMLGMHGHPTPNFMIQEADLVICIGSRFDDRITGKSSEFIPVAKKASQEGRGGVVHVDIRLTENGKQVFADYFVHSKGKDFLNVMNMALVERNSAEPFANHASWLARKKLLEAEYPITIPTFPSQVVRSQDQDEKKDSSSEDNDSPTSTLITKTPMSAQHVVKTMNSLLVNSHKIDDCIFSTGVGIHQMVAAQLITWTKPRQMISSGSLGTMGVALGFAIGAQLANDGRICIAVDGDGSFNMTFTELKTLAEQGIPVKILILDNESQMMVEYWQRLFQESRYIAVRNTHNPKYTTLASAFGIKSLYADCQEDLEDKMREFLFEDQDKPVLFHVKIERTPCLPLVAPGTALDNMILVDEDFEVDKSAAPS